MQHMNCKVINDKGVLIRIIEKEPECGKDFCEICGDCLHCYGGDPCYNARENGIDHIWLEEE